MKNLASRDTSANHVAEVDHTIREELCQARIPVIQLPKVQDHSEVPTTVQGKLCGWTFVRAWYYWVADGPALLFEFADPLHEHIGQEVRRALWLSQTTRVVQKPRSVGRRQLPR
jgi:hypothetical protein